MDLKCPFMPLQTLPISNHSYIAIYTKTEASFKRLFATGARVAVGFVAPLAFLVTVPVRSIEPLTHPFQVALPLANSPLALPFTLPVSVSRVVVPQVTRLNLDVALTRLPRPLLLLGLQVRSPQVA